MYKIAGKRYRLLSIGQVIPAESIEVAQAIALMVNRRTRMAEVHQDFDTRRFSVRHSVHLVEAVEDSLDDTFIELTHDR